MSEINYDRLALEQVRKRRLLIDRCDAYLFDLIRPFLGARVLEVGCGLGNLIPHLLDKEILVATDIEPGSIDEVNRRFGQSPNVQAQVCDISNPSAVALSRFKCDTVICLNALEHIQDDRGALANMAQIVVPGGRVVIIVPAFQFLYGTMDASIGHYRRYTHRDLAAKIEKAGLRLEKQYYFNLLGIVGWFVNGKLLRQTVPPSSQLRFYNLIFPIASKIEEFLPRVAGLSLVSISCRR